MTSPIADGGSRGIATARHELRRRSFRLRGKRCGVSERRPEIAEDGLGFPVNRLGIRSDEGLRDLRERSVFSSPFDELGSELANIRRNSASAAGRLSSRLEDVTGVRTAADNASQGRGARGPYAREHAEDRPDEQAAQEA